MVLIWPETFVLSPKTQRIHLVSPKPDNGGKPFVESFPSQQLSDFRFGSAHNSTTQTNAGEHCAAKD
jgi:hypothetical protein